MDALLKALELVIITVLVMLISAIITGIIVKWCWNGTMPYLFELPRINFIQGFCLSVLASVFVKSNLSKSKEE